MTIQKLGKAAFDKNLKRFRKAQEMVEKKCRPLAIFPCDDNGVYTPREYTNCLWKDSGCANDCVDQIALQV